MPHILLFLAIAIITIHRAAIAQPLNTSFRPGKKWTDTNGNPIQAHGGGILFYEGTYYWYGENKDSVNAPMVVLPGWSVDRVDVIGVSCYSSKDMYNWKFESLALPAAKNNPESDLHPKKVVERPKVIYNRITKKFVMWLHIDSEDYKAARSGVAIADKPEGPFTYLGSFRPNGLMARDMTLFADDDGKAYQFYSSEDNKTMIVSELTADYLKPSGRYKRIFIDQSREAPAVFKHNEKYYCITSGCTGWAPNPSEYAVADSPLGEWQVKGNPAKGEGAQTTFNAQGTFVIPVQGKANTYIFMADRWLNKELKNSSYVWLPLQVKPDGSLEIYYKKEWKLSEFTP
ncbi:glycoside hydrolase family 43 protein [Desertivirga xinjiangensis]|uniref:glycoside hydrolase family 43 protein n=1 Tax=Desertivirga xinjiangensis TaxID=539206 RepID=UPI00210CE02D|nr:glycoside hydrolase family 43 protein [Pedobacter xinjiangensis]